MIEVYRSNALKRNMTQIGKTHLVLVEGFSKRSRLQFQGRNDQNTRVILPNNSPIPFKNGGGARNLERGDYVAVHINDANSQGLKGIPLYLTSIGEFYEESYQHVAAFM